MKPLEIQPSLSQQFWQWLLQYKSYGFSLINKKKRTFAFQNREWVAGNSLKGRKILQNELIFADYSFKIQDIFAMIEGQIEPHSQALTYLHSFGFLRDLLAVPENNARKFARQIIENWILYHQSSFSNHWFSKAWDIEIVALRLYSLIIFHQELISTSSDQFKEIIENEIDRNFRFLSRHWTFAKDNMCLFWCLSSLVIAYSNGYDQYIHHHDALFALYHLRKKINLIVLNDGMLALRDPSLQVYIVQNLIEVRTALLNWSNRLGLKKKSKANQKIIDQLNDLMEFIQKKIDAMTNIIRLMRHGDGMLTHLTEQYTFWKGLNFTPSSDQIDSILSMSLSDSPRPLTRSPYGGLERLTNKKSIILVNTNMIENELSPRFPSLSIHHHSDSEDPIDKPLDVLNFDWSFGPLRIIETAEFMIQLPTGEWIESVDKSSSLLKIKRHFQENKSVCAFELESTLKHFSFSIQKFLMLNSEQLLLKARETFQFNFACMVALKFKLNPLCEVRKLHDNICLTFPEKTAKENFQSSKMNTAFLQNHRANHKAPATWIFRSLGEDQKDFSNDSEYPEIILFKSLSKKKQTSLQWSFEIES